jgi:small redox-active disulfide protein 2
MKKLQILGPGCSKCRKLAEETELAARELGLEYEIEKVSSIERMVSMGVMATPALVVDGVVRSTGRVPSPAELKKILS